MIGRFKKIKTKTKPGVEKRYFRLRKQERQSLGSRKVLSMFREH